MEELQIVLDLPPRALQPNARPHFRVKAEAKKKATQLACDMCFFEMKDQEIIGGWDAAWCQATFFLKRKMDRDNLGAWLKSYQDGFQRAGLLKNDDAVQTVVSVVKEKVNPRVELLLHRANKEDFERYATVMEKLMAEIIEKHAEVFPELQFTFGCMQRMISVRNGWRTISQSQVNQQAG